MSTEATNTPPASEDCDAAPKLAIAVGDSQNKKIGEAAATYAAQTSCPTSCPFFNGGGCYAESGNVRHITARLNAAAKAEPSGPYEVAMAEAETIDALEVVPRRPLRLHTVGDCATDEAARIIAAAAERYRRRGGGPVWTYTHAWREVSRDSWGEVSVLASCETAEDVSAARARGYATAVVVEAVTQDSRHHLGAQAGDAAGLDVLPCPQQTRGRTCSQCRICFDEKGRLFNHGYSIAFLVHGDAATVRHAKKALRSPDDPERRLSSRVLIPRAIAELKAAGKKVTNAAIAQRLGLNPSSVHQMRKRMALEASQAAARSVAGVSQLSSDARDQTHKLDRNPPCPKKTSQFRGVMASPTTDDPPLTSGRRPHRVVRRRSGSRDRSEVSQ